MSQAIWLLYAVNYCLEILKMQLNCLGRNDGSDGHAPCSSSGRRNHVTDDVTDGSHINVGTGWAGGRSFALILSRCRDAPPPPWNEWMMRLTSEASLCDVNNAVCHHTTLSRDATSDIRRHVTYNIPDSSHLVWIIFPDSAKLVTAWWWWWG